MSIHKKIIFGFVMAWAFVISGNAMAVESFGETEQSITVTGGVGNDCPLLAENVTLGVSANVIGGWACDEGNNIIQVAACHKGGSRDEVSCASYDDQPASVDGTPTNIIPGCSDTTGVGDPDFKAFFATSQGGVMAEKGLGTRCTTSSLEGLSDWAN